MPDLPADLIQTIERLKENEEKHHLYLNGNQSATIPIPGGQINSIAKSISGLNQKVALVGPGGALKTANALSELSTEVQKSEARRAMGVFSKEERNAARNAAAPRQGVIFRHVGGTGFGGSGGTDLIPNAIPATGDFSLVFPAISYLSGTGGALLILDNGGSDDARFDIRFGTNAANQSSPSIRVFIGASSVTLNLSTPIKPRTQLALVLDRTNSVIYGYVNGAIAGSVSITAMAALILATSLRLVTFTLGQSWSFSQAIVYNYALTAQQIADRYASGIWVPAEERHQSSDPIISPTTLNGGFETAGAGGADVFSDWTEIASGSSAIVRDTVDFHSGTASCRLDVVSGASVYINQSNVFVPGLVYKVTFWAKTGNGGPSLRVETLSGGRSGIETWRTGSDLPALTEDWQFYEFVIPSANTAGTLRFIRNFGSGSIWIDDVSLTPQAATLALTPQGLGRQLLDTSASRNHALATTHPAYTQPANSCLHKITVTNNTGDATNTNLSLIQPANTYIESIHFIRTSVSGAFRVGTDSGGSQVVASTSSNDGIATLVTTRPTTVNASLFVHMEANTTYELIIKFKKNIKQ